MNQKSVVLIILDGFGMSPISEGNAVYQAKTPFFSNLIKNYPSCLLSASGAEVGLDWGEMGNSEVGHFNLGTGRVVLQDFARINRSIEDKTFFINESLLQAADHVKKHGSTLHLLGLLSTGGVHAHLDHLKSLLDFCRLHKVERVALHLFSDGRDTAPKIVGHLLGLVREKIQQLKQDKNYRIASLVGRFYAMDRDKHWERTRLAYDLLTQGKGQKFATYQEALDSSYQNHCFDEEVKPVILEPKMVLKDDDAVIFFNFRRDRARQIIESLIDPKFAYFPRERVIDNLFFVGFVNIGLEPSPRVKIAFFAEQLAKQLADVFAQEKLTHLHIAETEKYAHVTYFFNGGQEAPFDHEERILVPSPRVDSYAKVPQMSAAKVTEKFLDYFHKKRPAFTVINFANADMVGHTGDFQATIKAVEIVDQCLGRILTQLSPLASQILVTADHGNAEQMTNPETQEIDKEHTTNPVPFIMVNSKFEIRNSKIEGVKENKEAKLELASRQPLGVLADVSATVLDILHLARPEVMTGTTLKGNI